jgi:hypothetical protein
LTPPGLTLLLGSHGSNASTLSGGKQSVLAMTKHQAIGMLLFGSPGGVKTGWLE